MARRKQTNYERQAQISIALAIVGGICALGGAFFIFQAFDWQNFWMVYSPQGKRVLAIAGALGLSFLFGVASFFLGFNSAGQRSNKQSGLSWAGFGLGAFVITLALAIGVFFWKTKYAVQV